MRETISQRRTKIEDALQNQLPATTEFDQYRDGPVTVGRPRTHGHVFLALVDGLSSEPRSTDRAVPIAAALELASLQTHVHREAIRRDRSHDGEYDPTRDVLRGDLLESTAFETLLSAGGSSEHVRRCFAVLVRTTRRAQEGRAIVSEDDVDPLDAAPDVRRRLGALTGGAAELAALEVGLDDDLCRRLAEHGTELGYRLWVRTETGEKRADERQTTGSRAACRRQIEALADCCPDRSATQVRRQLAAFLEEELRVEFPEQSA
ncbi:polyprenyl synthetase family protein [Natronolimnohabitans innermongolicus]|uniref:Bifunctional short chain isoprenyl diphosphate synthase n=1 Tax=Natronolimnohabitans innermongolicus JCM 12255 TaxID=1227499 RepID=L9WNJ5_9EURY|nr:hypothetical protein [Natronolimnohabitans innermongolicus]ELY51014.1 Bifunctional short chain isoprenyl diphosphate synthase [Natronolimnohabitans innermongolicus JCM 12255]